MAKKFTLSDRQFISHLRSLTQRPGTYRQSSLPALKSGLRLDGKVGSSTRKVSDPGIGALSEDSGTPRTYHPLQTVTDKDGNQMDITPLQTVTFRDGQGRPVSITYLNPDLQAVADPPPTP